MIEFDLFFVPLRIVLRDVIFVGRNVKCLTS